MTRNLTAILFTAVLGLDWAIGDAVVPLPLTEPLAEVAEKHKGRSILVVFTAHWDASGPLLDKLMEDERVAAVFRSDGIVSYIADCTKGEGVGAIEARQHGIHAAPMAAAVLHPDGKITFTRLNLSSAETLARDLQSLIEKAQQGVAPQSATRSESDSEGGDEPQPESEPRSR